MKFPPPEFNSIVRLSDKEWQQILSRYRAQLANWQVIPSYVWLSLIVASAAMVVLLPSVWRLLAALLGFYSSAQLGSRGGNIDGFQIGYEWGKETSIMNQEKTDH